MMEDLALKVTVVAHNDSSACREICNWRGLGKLRHMEVALLWLQQCVQSGRVVLRQIVGSGIQQTCSQSI